MIGSILYELEYGIPSEGTAWGLAGGLVMGMYGLLPSILVVAVSTKFIKRGTSQSNGWNNTVAGQIFYWCGAVTPLITYVGLMIIF